MKIKEGEWKGKGKVKIDDGTVVVSGDVLTEAQLVGLKFTDNDVAATETSAFTYQVFDGQATVAGTVNFTVIDADATQVIQVPTVDLSGATFDFEGLALGDPAGTLTLGAITFTGSCSLTISNEGTIAVDAKIDTSFGFLYSKHDE